MRCGLLADCGCHTPVRGVISLKHSISTAEAGAVDVDFTNHPLAHKAWLLRALDHSAYKLMTCRERTET